MTLNLIPANEPERLSALVELDPDYADIRNNFKELTTLAAKIAGTPISMINLIDEYTLWSISPVGMETEQTPREDTICQHTIMGNTPFEVKDLGSDARFQDKDFVTSEPNLRYYLGVPLKSKKGYNLGSLCVMDTVKKELDLEKIELLKIIAEEIVKRLRSINIINNLQEKLAVLTETQKKVAHDIRGPIGGIVGLSQLITEQGENNKMDEIMQVFSLIQKSGNSILELADEILSTEKVEKRETTDLMNYQLNLLTFKEKLDELYTPQAINKSIGFTIAFTPETATVPFSKNKLLQITGNLISNSMKFTPVNGEVAVSLELKVGNGHNMLNINVKDSGIGLSKEKIRFILEGNATSTDGTGGEKGYGFGLALVKHLVDSLGGTMEIDSNPGQGAEFKISLPQD